MSGGAVLYCCTFWGTKMLRQLAAGWGQCKEAPKLTPKAAAGETITITWQRWQAAICKFSKECCVFTSVLVDCVLFVICASFTGGILLFWLWAPALFTNLLWHMLCCWWPSIHAPKRALSQWWKNVSTTGYWALDGLTTGVLGNACFHTHGTRICTNWISVYCHNTGGWLFLFVLYHSFSICAFSVVLP